MEERMGRRLGLRLWTSIIRELISNGVSSFIIPSVSVSEEMDYWGI
jgi:hypothetical protein